MGVHTVCMQCDMNRTVCIFACLFFTRTSCIVKRKSSGESVERIEGRFGIKNVVVA